MKIAICGFGFSGATLPLAKALSSNENVSGVDCFYLAYRSNSIKSIESIDFHNEKLILGIPHSLHKDNIIYRYLPSNVDVHIVPLCPNGPKWFRWISRFVNIIIIWGLAMYLLKKKYGFINIVAHTSLEFLLIRLVMPFKKVIVSIHEIYQSLNGAKVLKRDLVNILNSKIDVVFHSNSVQREFELRALHRRCKCHTIPFSNSILDSDKMAFVKTVERGNIKIVKRRKIVIIFSPFNNFIIFFFCLLIIYPFCHS